MDVREGLELVLKLQEPLRTSRPKDLVPTAFVLSRSGRLSIIGVPPVLELGAPLGMAAAGAAAVSMTDDAELVFLSGLARHTHAVTGEDRGLAVTVIGGDADGHVLAADAPASFSEDGVLDWSGWTVHEESPGSLPSVQAFWEAYLAGHD